jgi:hypothetical protein
MAPTDCSASSASSILDKIESKWCSRRKKFIYYYLYDLSNMDNESIINVDENSAIVLSPSPER